MAGVAAAGPWIERASPTYPCLVDEGHVVSELYDMVNVPTAVWIDEQGQIVRPPEPAGTNDAFRSMDRVTFAIPDDARQSLRATRAAYLDALRDWARNGPGSRFALPPAEVERRLAPADESHALAALQFCVGEYLQRGGDPAGAQSHIAEALRLRPESWNYRRQGFALEDPAKAGGPEYWAAVDALGDTPYYPLVELERRD